MQQLARESGSPQPLSLFVPLPVLAPESAPGMLSFKIEEVM